jgi:hypothetical protein
MPLRPSKSSSTVTLVVDDEARAVFRPPNECKAAFGQERWGLAQRVNALPLKLVSVGPNLATLCQELRSDALEIRMSHPERGDVSQEDAPTVSLVGPGLKVACSSGQFGLVLVPKTVDRVPVESWWRHRGHRH